MQIADSVALVTGANRGLGHHFVTQLLERRAARAYATARNPESATLPGAGVLGLDIADPVSVAAAAAAASDVTPLVNYADINTMSGPVDGDPGPDRTGDEPRLLRAVAYDPGLRSDP